MPEDSPSVASTTLSNNRSSSPSKSRFSMFGLSSSNTNTRSSSNTTSSGVASSFFFPKLTNTNSNGSNSQSSSDDVSTYKFLIPLSDNTSSTPTTASSSSSSAVPPRSSSPLNSALGRLSRFSMLSCRNTTNSITTNVAIDTSRTATNSSNNGFGDSDTKSISTDEVSQYKSLIPQPQAVGAGKSDAFPTSLGLFSGALVDNSTQSSSISITRSDHIAAPPSQFMCWPSPSRSNGSNDTSSRSPNSVSITSPLIHSKGRVVKNVTVDEHSIGGGVIDGMCLVEMHGCVMIVMLIFSL